MMRHTLYLSWKGLWRKYSVIWRNCIFCRQNVIVWMGVAFGTTSCITIDRQSSLSPRVGFFHPPFLWPGSWSSGLLKEILEERFASFPSFFSMPMRVVWAFLRIWMCIGISVPLNSWIGKLFLGKLGCYEMTKVRFENKNSNSTLRDGQGFPWMYSFTPWNGLSVWLFVCLSLPSCSSLIWVLASCIYCHYRFTVTHTSKQS